MLKYALLNLGCGQRYHKKWTNVDFYSHNNDVISADLIKGIPFQDDYFDVVYHSHLLEHLPKEKSLPFIKECYRVLKPGGIIRVVVPDLENMVKEYLRVLNCIDTSQNLEEANYEWILLEILDQMVRIHPGGEMAAYLAQKQITNEHYIYSRVGEEMRELRESLTGFTNREHNDKKKKPVFRGKITILKILNKIKKSIPIKELQVAYFRSSGEIHQWMYDRYSLKNLLNQGGFDNIEVFDASKSNISNWGGYELDIKNGIIHKPNSLFIEAFKPFV